jgi:hypothetical protein
MSHRANRLAIASAAALTIVASAQAASVLLLAMIPVPGEPLESYDIGIVNEQTDRSNKSIDIFDAVKNTFVGRVPGFVGFTGSGGTMRGTGCST